MRADPPGDAHKQHATDLDLGEHFDLVHLGCLERLDMHAQRESAHTVCWGVFDSEAAPNGSKYFMHT